jgi:DNA primase catalytic subunit
MEPPIDPHGRAHLLRLYYNVGRDDSLRLPADAMLTLVDASPQRLERHEFSICFPDEFRRPRRRYISIPDAASLRRVLIQSDATEVHVGARYSSVGDAKKYQKKPDGRWALTFDFDASDHPLLAAHQPGANMHACDQWWPLIEEWVRIVRDVLRLDFAFTNFLAVYTGNRGAHLHVLDTRVECYTNETRGALATYLVLPVHKSGVPGLLQTLNVHPSVNAAYERQVRPFFEKILCARMNFLATAANRTATLAMLPPTGVRPAVCAALAASWERRCADVPVRSAELWAMLKAKIKLEDRRKTAAILRTIILSWCWPRIDFNVSKETAHLVRHPFSVHRTGRIALPFDLDRPRHFQPQHVPTLAYAGRPWAEIEKVMPHAHEYFNEALALVDQAVARRAEEGRRVEELDGGESSTAPKRQRVSPSPPVVSLCDPVAARSAAAVLSAHDRIMLVVVCTMKMMRPLDIKNINVYISYTAHPTMASGPAIRVPADTYPPFPSLSAVPDGASTAPRSVREPLYAMVECVKTCCTRPREMQHAASRTQLLVLRRVQTLADANRSFERMATWLAKPVEIATVRLDWGRLAIESVLKQRVLPLLEQDLRVP